MLRRILAALAFMAPLPLLALDVTLTAAPVNWEVAPGLTVAAWAYNGTVPGPALRAQPSETIRVTLVNNLAEPTTIHWHGVPVPNGMDGVPGVSALVVQPGQTFAYLFTAPSPGTYWYHPHFDSAAQIGRGLYGLLIVDPPAGSPLSSTREVPLVIGEFGARMPGRTTTVSRSMGGMNGSGSPMMGAAMGGLFLINGKTAPAVPDLVVNRGDKVLFRFVNTGNMVHPMHVHGLHWQVTATDGFDVPSPYAKDTLPINAGERYDAVLDADNPGTWMIHCHNLTHVGDGPVGLAFQIIVR